MQRRTRRSNGIPRALTDETFELDGEPIANPLRSFVLPVGDRRPGQQDIASDPNARTTASRRDTRRCAIRSPGWSAPRPTRRRPKEHNAGFPNYAANVKTLDANIMAWLTLPVVVGRQSIARARRRQVRPLPGRAQLHAVLQHHLGRARGTPTNPQDLVVPLESPHNYIHLAVGGFDIPDLQRLADPRRQRRHGRERHRRRSTRSSSSTTASSTTPSGSGSGARTRPQRLTIDQDDPGASYAQNQPPAGGNPGDMLTMADAADPVPPSGREPDDQRATASTSRAARLRLRPRLARRYRHAGHTAPMAARRARRAGRTVQVSGINRAKIAGSFVISAFANDDGKREYVGTNAVLSRWHVEGCMNCQNHLEAKATFPLAYDSAHFLAEDAQARGGIEVEVRTHTGLYGGAPRRAAAATLASEPRGTRRSGWRSADPHDGRITPLPLVCVSNTR